MKITTSTPPLSTQKKDAAILFFRGKQPLSPECLDTALTELVRDSLTQTAFEGKPGQVALFPTYGRIASAQMILAGVGDVDPLSAERLEQAAAAAIRAGRAAGMKSFAVNAAPDASFNTADYQLLVGRGAGWGSYEAVTFKSQSKKKPEITLTFSGPDHNRNVRAVARAHSAALCAVADLANAPGNVATPEYIADWAKSMAKENRLACRVLTDTDLKKKGCGGILAVARGSARGARMILLEHTGTNPQAKPIVLVGKTLTFDSGGISLKPGKGMGWMRYDKCGGMAVLATMQMIAQTNPAARVVAILAAAENMPGPEATRPGDIITAYKGKTIEVLNTDAEGRLVLADALGLAVDYDPCAIIDIATLTGAVIMALGSAAAAVVGNEQGLVNQLITAGTQAGERLWQLPLYPEYTDDMQSDFADICNISRSSGAGTATAAAFLEAFVPKTIPWAHIDIAGTAWTETAKPHQGPGATLYGARLLAQWIASL